MNEPATSEAHNSGGDSEQALLLIKRYGWNATSFQSLEPGFRYWFDSGGEGCVAYADTGGAWVAAGAPIAPEERLLEVAEQFCRAARLHGRRVCFFAVERRFLRASGFPAFQIGEQPIWDPASWDGTLRTSRSLREQLRRARAKGVSVRPLPADALEREEHPRRRGVDHLISHWLDNRRMPPMGFLVQVNPYSFVGERRFFIAEQNGRMVGFLAAVPIYARGGWLFEDLLRDSGAPNGTAELLIDCAMRTVAAEGSRYVTLGLAPLAGQINRWLRAARRLGRGLYNFEGLRAFKSRLRPHRWEPIFVAYDPGQLPWVAVYDTLGAFAHGGLLRFGVRSMLHSPELVIWGLTLLLAPWTALLAGVAPAAWFPAPWVRLAWTTFDLLLLGGLLALCLRPRLSLAKLLACLVSADAALTLVEVLTFNLRQLHGPWELLWLGVAVTGPAAAALFLWAAARRWSRLRDPDL